MPSEEIYYLPLTELARRIEAKKLSPVELTQAYLTRSEKLGPRFNAYARLTPELALSQAKAAEKEIQRGHYRGPLHGIPYAAKDLLAVKGVPTTWGAKPYENQVFDYDATVIEHLHRAGQDVRLADTCGRVDHGPGMTLGVEEVWTMKEQDAVEDIAVEDPVLVIVGMLDGVEKVAPTAQDVTSGGVKVDGNVLVKHAAPRRLIHPVALNRRANLRGWEAGGKGKVARESASGFLILRCAIILSQSQMWRRCQQQQRVQNVSPPNQQLLHSDFSPLPSTLNTSFS